MQRVYNESMNQEFTTAYAQLNKAQRQAVDAIDGPVLVIAGPGTGKTQLLSLRVANILSKTDTDPGSVLCLTFTNFAATNMQQRLATLVGPDAQATVVRTFHSFAAEIMNLYPEYFWQGARLQIAPDTTQLDIIQTILSELPLDNPLATKFAGAYTALNDAQQSLKLAKEAGLTPSKLAAMLQANTEYLDKIESMLVDALTPTLSQKRLSVLQQIISTLPPQAIDQHISPLTSLGTVIQESLRAALADDEATGKLTQTGKWKRRWLQTVDGQKGMFDERRRLAWWQALAEVYATYQSRLHQMGYYDYADMILEVIGQLEQQPELLASVQERFLYVLIDEFQDTNAAQLRLAHLVASHPASEGRPNLMAVGDDDQAIFAFNGAELSNMLAFRRTYANTQTIMLTENYRSSQVILDAAEQVIQQAEDRLVKRDTSLKKNLKAQNAIKSPKNGLVHLSFPTREQQMTAIADHVAKEWQAGSNQSIAVLARHHHSLKEMSALLNERGIPIRYEQQNNVLEQPLVQQVNLLAETVKGIADGNPKQVNFYLSRLLAHSAWRMQPEQLWQIAASQYGRGSWLDSLLESKDKAQVKIGKWLLWLAQQSASEPLPVMIEYFVGLRVGQHMTSPLREHFINRQAVSNEYLSGLSGLAAFRSTINDFTANLQRQSTLDDLVHLLDLHRQLGRSLTDESWFASGDQAVQLLTIHKSKGLEFDTVILLDAVHDNWRPRHLSRKPPANLPLQPYGEVYDDYVRLMYVAATRAKHSWLVSTYQNDEKGKPLLATPLVHGLTEDETRELPASESLRVLEQALTWPRLETDQAKSLLSARLRDFKLSATGLLDFLDVSSGGPEHFVERHLLRLPELTTANMAFGTAVHKALQAGNATAINGQPDLDKLISTYQAALRQQQLSPSEEKRYQTHGEQVLISLFKNKGFTLPPGGQAELKLTLSDSKLGNLIGNLDHVVAEEKHLIITDYKTGQPLSSFATRDQTKAIKAWRQRTQLEFYALLANKSGYFKTPGKRSQTPHVMTQIVYVEAEQPKQLRLELEPTKQDLERLEKLVAAAWQCIANLSFPNTSSYSESAQGIADFESDLINGKY